MVDSEFPFAFFAIVDCLQRIAFAEYHCNSREFRELCEKVKCVIFCEACDSHKQAET
jgi:hypothetical protein